VNRVRPALRIAVSGSAGTGKTTLAGALARRLDLPLLPEAMRRYLEAGGARLPSLGPVRARAVLAGFHRELLALETASPGFVADNGVLDLCAYAAWAGCAPEPPPPVLRYDVLLLLPWGAIPYERDGVRGDSPEAEQRFQALLEQLLPSWSRAVRVLRVPPELVRPDARLDWVLARL
jgi:predicted ATPase